MKRKSTVIVAVLLVTIVAAGLFWFSALQRGQQSSRPDKVAFTFDWIIGGFYAPYILADEQGFYRDENIMVTFEQGQGADTAAKLVDQGKYDVTTGNAAATAVAVSNGLRIRSVAMIDQNAVTAIFSLKDARINSPADLLGKRLGVRYFDVSHSEYLAMMKAQNLDPKKVTDVSIGFDLQPLLSRRIDAMYNYAYNMPIQLRLQGVEISEFLVKDFGVIGYGANIVAGETFINNRSDVLKRFLRASARGWTLARQNPQLAIDILAKRYPEINKTVALATFKAETDWLRPLTDDPVSQFCQDSSKWTSTLNTYESVGLIKTAVQATNVYTNAFLNSCP